MSKIGGKLVKVDVCRFILKTRVFTKGALKTELFEKVLFSKNLTFWKSSFLEKLEDILENLKVS